MQTPHGKIWTEIKLVNSSNFAFTFCHKLQINSSDWRNKRSHLKTAQPTHVSAKEERSYARLLFEQFKRKRQKRERKRKSPTSQSSVYLSVSDSNSARQSLLYNKIIIQVSRLHNSWIGSDSGVKSDGLVKVIGLARAANLRSVGSSPSFLNIQKQWLTAVESSVVKSTFFTPKAMKIKRTRPLKWELNIKGSKLWGSWKKVV